MDIEIITTGNEILIGRVIDSNKAWIAERCQMLGHKVVRHTSVGDDEQAIETTRELGRNNGLLVGISSGANVWAARELSKHIDGNIATILPDRAERYFSTALL